MSNKGEQKILLYVDMGFLVDELGTHYSICFMIVSLFKQTLREKTTKPDRRRPHQQQKPLYGVHFLHIILVLCSKGTKAPFITIQ